MTAPKSVKGYVDPYAVSGNNYFTSLYADILEHIPDLVFPNSMYVYSRMRRDPKLQAILQGWTLNLRRAQWQLDPAGCRPEVVDVCADATGLHIVGVDRPSAARLRGVSWNDHLAAALRMLPFGFSAFEMEADTSTGQALLTGLWERPQWTIQHIHVDGKTGLLEGATQGALWKAGPPQMKADNLIWYTHEREGSNWAGTSLLRACYASWLIKEELRRIHAVANRRWSAGVPVMEALPGTNPSPAQMAEAQQMASAARGGETAGAATPPGFTLKIQGLSGSVPDTLSFLQWLDQQMTGSALMGALDLGQTPNGSRALGDTFMDSFLLALEATAEAVADTATRQICARVVAWNYGTDEPVPRVVASGVGSRREVTAESLNLLLGAGALAADPALEAWVRREYRLPERDPNSPFEVKAPKGQMITVPGTGGDGAATGPGQPAPPSTVAPAAPAAVQPVKAGARPRTSRRRAANQPTLFAAAEDPDAGHQLIQQQWVQAKADLLAQWPATAQPMVDELAGQAETAVADDDLGALGSLAVSAGVLAAVVLLLNRSGKGLAVAAAAGVVAEAAVQGVSIKAPGRAGADRVRQTADAVAGIISAGYASGAARAALQLAGADPAAVRDAVAQHLTDLGTSANGLVGENVGALLSAAQHAGRLAVLEAHPATAYVAVEASDGPNRCKPCGQVNNTRYDTLAEALKDYPSAGFRGCLGKSRCRGGIHPIF